MGGVQTLRALPLHWRTSERLIAGTLAIFLRKPFIL